MPGICETCALYRALQNQAGPKVAWWAAVGRFPSFFPMVSVPLKPPRQVWIDPRLWAEPGWGVAGSSNLSMAHECDRPLLARQGIRASLAV